MSIADMLVHEVQILRTTSMGRDRLGGPTPIVTSTTVNAYLEPLHGSEDLQNRNTEVGVWMIVVGPEVDIIGWDHVVWETHTFEVTSPPSPHMNVRTRRTEYFRAELQEISVEGQELTSVPTFRPGAFDRSFD